MNEENIGEYVSSSPREVTHFIENNFSRVVEEYNKTSEETWLASSIEQEFEIIIDDANTQYPGMFLDFDNDNGYAVVGNDYQFMDFSITGESPYLGIETESYCFSTIGGYMFLYEGEYVKKEEMNIQKEEAEDLVNCQKAGQDSDATGVGQINDSDEYMKANYGEGWFIENGKE